MAFDKTLPANGTKIRDYPTVLGNNFTAIQEGDDTLQYWQTNYVDRDTVAGAPPPTQDPVAIADTMVVFSKNDGSNTELFSMDPSSVISQLTFTDRSLAQTGYAALSPGFLIQWGRGTMAGSTQTLAVVFPKAFSSTAWIVTSTPYSSLITGSSPREWGVENITDTGFDARSFNGTVPGGGVPFGWFAIGPL
jgi:hypothetical protein